MVMQELLGGQEWPSRHTTSCLQARTALSDNTYLYDGYTHTEIERPETSG